VREAEAARPGIRYCQRVVFIKEEVGMKNRPWTMIWSLALVALLGLLLTACGSGEKAEDLGQQVQDAAAEAGEAAGEAAAAAGEAAGEALEEGVETVKEGAEEAAEAVGEAAEDAQKAVEEAAEDAQKKVEGH
jgi:hypothetical protein